jgi:CubicO group peptidase (beta-lactamase class C family)
VLCLLASAGANAWEDASLESVGLSPGVVQALDEDIKAGRYGYIDSLFIARHGKVAFETYYQHDYPQIYKTEAETPGPLVVNDPSGPYNYFNAWWHPYYRDTNLHSLQSVTKSVVSALVGIAISRGDFPALDTPVLSFFDETSVTNVDERKLNMNLRDLLTMSDGLEWNENLPYTDPQNSFAVMTRDPNWVTHTIDLPMAKEPGTVFNYNSGATLVLGHVFNVATGIDIEEYAVKHLFSPLGIEHYYWDRTPFGQTDTQEGLYLSTRDLAKITRLYLQGGRFDGMQVIPRSWIDDSLTPAFLTKKNDREGYGYLWWSQPYTHKNTEHMAYFGKGFGGQRPILLPELDMVIVLTGWNILPGQPFLYAEEAITRITAAVAD